MAPVRACIRPYVQNFFTVTPHSLLGGIDSNFKNYYRCLYVRKERMVKIFIDQESLAPHRCEFKVYQGSVWLWHTHFPTLRLHIRVILLTFITLAR